MIAWLPWLVGVSVGVGAAVASKRWKRVNLWFDVACGCVAAAIAVLIALGNFSRWDAMWPALAVLMLVERHTRPAK